MKMPPARKLAGALLAFGLVTTAMVVIWQHRLSVSEVNACQVVRHKQQRDLEMQRAAQDHWQQLLDEIDGARAELDTLSGMLPEDVGVAGFVETLGARLGARGLEVCASSSRITDRDFFREAEVALEVCGPKAERDSLASEPGWLVRSGEPRILKVDQVRPSPERLHATVTLYACRGDEARPDRDWCDPAHWPAVRTWLWPFAGRARAARDRLEELCAEIEANREALVRMLELQALRVRIQHFRSIIDALLARGAEVSAPAEPDSG